MLKIIEKNFQFRPNQEDPKINQLTMSLKSTRNLFLKCLIWMLSRLDPLKMTGKMNQKLYQN